MAETIVTLPPGDAKPCFTQHGGRLLVCYEDLRPLVLMPGKDGAIRAFSAGIKPPLTAPALELTGPSGSSLPQDGQAYVAYAFFSSSRKVLSEISPVASVALADRQLRVSGFEAPRDNPLTEEIDTIMVGLQVDGAPGLMCWPDLMSVPCADGNFAGKELVFDIAPDRLAFGFNLTEASKFAAVPPAFQFCEALGERVWYGGQRERVNFANTVLSVEGVSETDNAGEPYPRNFRGRTCAKLTLAGEGSFHDGHLYLALHMSGKFLGFIFDVVDAKTAFLDRNQVGPGAGGLRAGVNLVTADFYLAGVRDRIWPSSWHTSTLGNIPTAYPECINLGSACAIPAMSDQHQIIRGLKASAQGLVILLNDGAVLMANAFQVGLPKPEFTVLPGTSGCVAPRSVTRTPEGQIGWVGQRGPEMLGGAEGGNLALAAGCGRLFRGQEWIDPRSLADCVMACARDFEGFVIGNLTVNGAPDHWLLFTRRPQLGFWLMDGQELTSNILEYADDFGQSVLLAGDSQGARVKRLLAPGTLEDLPTLSDLPAPYVWAWRGGWDASPRAKRVAAQYASLEGLIVPGGEVQLTLTLWRSHFPVRHPADVPAANTDAKTVGWRDLQKDIPLKAGSWRYHSLELSGESTSGAAAGRPVELTRWTLVFQEEGAAR